MDHILHKYTTWNEFPTTIHFKLMITMEVIKPIVILYIIFSVL